MGTEFRRRIQSKKNDTELEIEDGLLYWFPLTSSGTDVIRGLSPTLENNVAYTDKGAYFANPTWNNIIEYPVMEDWNKVRRIEFDFCQMAYPSSNGSYIVAFGEKTLLSGNYGYRWYFGNAIWKQNKKFVYTLGSYNNGTYSTLLDSTTAGITTSLNNWYHVTATIDSNRQTLSVNGQLTNTWNYTRTMTATECIFRIGNNLYKLDYMQQDTTSRNRAFCGYIKDIKLFSTI